MNPWPNFLKLPLTLINPHQRTENMEQYESQTQFLGGTPTEINLLIFENLTKTDLKKLSVCSKRLYNICFRARFKSLILNPDTIPFLQNGVLYEETCRDIRTVRLGTKTKWSEDVKNLKCYREGRGADPEKFFTQLRLSIAALDLFPRLQKLCVSYEIPSAAENNTYLAVLKGIAQHGSGLCNSLEAIKIQVVKTILFQDFKDSFSHHEEKYKKLYSMLSSPNQDFLGKKIEDDEIDELVRTNAPKFPMLRSARISANCIAGPLSDPRSAYLERSGFYYIPLESATQLERLHIDTTDYDHIYNTYGFVKGDDRKEPLELNPDLLDVFSKITTLKFTTCILPTEDDLRKLVERFPKLRRLNIRMFEDSLLQCSLNEKTYPYENISKLTYLKELTLPWPRNERGSFASHILGEWTCKLQTNGLHHIRKVTWKGIKELEGGYSWGNIELICNISTWSDDGSLLIRVSGDKLSSAYADNQESGNPQNQP